MITNLLTFKKIFSLNGYTITNKTLLNKYTKYSYFNQNAKEQNLVFVSPSTWRDPFEQIYFTAKNYNEKYNYSKPTLYCMCLTANSSQNEDAAWTLYQNGTSEKIIKITFNAFEMFSQIDDFCIKNGYTVYVGEIDYSFASNEISSLSKASTPKRGINKNHELFFPKPFLDEHYLKLLLLKRKAFEFEHEIRLFLIKDDKSCYCNEDSFKISPFLYNDETINTIKIAPLQPFALTDPRHQIYNELQRAEEKLYKTEIKKVLKEIASKKIQQSSLYKQKKVKEL